MTEEFYNRLINLIKIVKRDNDRVSSHYLQGIMLGIRLAVRAFHWTYPDDPSTQCTLFGMEKIKKELDNYEN